MVTKVLVAGAVLFALAAPDSYQRMILLMPTEAAARLRCSLKTLREYVRSGELRYVRSGAGLKRPGRRFTDADIDEFIARRVERETPVCPSISRRAHRITTTTFNGAANGFMALRNARIAAKLSK